MKYTDELDKVSYSLGLSIASNLISSGVTTINAEAFIQPDYWVYDMPGRTLIINNAEYVAQSVTRKMKQSIKFPTYDDIDPMTLIKTDLGVGKIDKCTVSLSTRMNNVTLKY